MLITNKAIGMLVVFCNRFEIEEDGEVKAAEDKRNRGSPTASTRRRDATFAGEKTRCSLNSLVFSSFVCHPYLSRD